MTLLPTTWTVGVNPSGAITLTVEFGGERRAFGLSTEDADTLATELREAGVFARFYAEEVAKEQAKARCGTEAETDDEGGARS